jgi:hypothetical protein
LGQEQDYADELDEVPIDGNLDVQVGGQQDLVQERIDEVVDLIVVAVDEASDLQVRERMENWKAGWAVAEASLAGTSSMPASELRREVQCCFDAGADAVEQLHFAETELGRYRQGSGRRPKVEVKHLVSDFGSGQEMAAGLRVHVPETVLELEHAFAAFEAPVAYASAPPSERLATLHRSVLASELDVMVVCGADLDEVTVTVSYL